jgi:hypothetical protein
MKIKGNYFQSLPLEVAITFGLITAKVVIDTEHFEFSAKN